LYERDEKSGWWRADLHHKRGYILSGYVSVYFIDPWRYEADYGVRLPRLEDLPEAERKKRCSVAPPPAAARMMTSKHAGNASAGIASFAAANRGAAASSGANASTTASGASAAASRRRRQRAAVETRHRRRHQQQRHRRQQEETTMHRRWQSGCVLCFDDERETKKKKQKNNPGPTMRLFSSLSMVIVMMMISYAFGGVDVVGRIRNVAASDSASIRVRVSGEGATTYTTVPLSNGAFVIRDVPAGVYTLAVQSVKFAFANVRLDVATDSIRARLADDTEGKLVFPLDLAPTSVVQYFAEEQQFRITSILFNPMILMMLVMGGMSFLLPKLVDKDAMNELKNASNGANAADSSDASASADSNAAPAVEPPPSVMIPRLGASVAVHSSNNSKKSK
jgi:hypothetical protein